MEFILIWVCFSVLVWMMADKRGRSGFLWFLLSLFISPLLSIIFLLVAGDADAATCPQCAEKVKSEAKVCKHCGSSLLGNSKPVENEYKDAVDRFCTLYNQKVLIDGKTVSQSTHDTFKSIKLGNKVDIEIVKFETVALS